MYMHVLEYYILKDCRDKIYTVLVQVPGTLLSIRDVIAATSKLQLQVK
jgi:hypothetical protein